MFWYVCVVNRLEVTSSFRVQKSMIVSHKFNAGMPSMRNPASSDAISASVLLWDTTICLFFYRFMKLAQMYAIQRYTEHHVRLTVSQSNFLQFAVYSLIPNVTILSVVGCVIDVNDETFD